MISDQARAFFEGNKIPVEKMAMIGGARRGLSYKSVEDAAEQIYNQVQEGETIPPIRLAWRVYSMAKRIKSKDDDSTRHVEEMKARIDAWYALPWWKRVFRGNRP